MNKKPTLCNAFRHDYKYNIQSEAVTNVWSSRYLTIISLPQPTAFRHDYEYNIQSGAGTNELSQDI